MAQFIAYQNPNPATRKQYPYLLDIQSNLLSELKTTVVVPLTHASIASAISLTRLNPSVKVDGEIYIAMTQDIAGLERNQLGLKACDLSAYRAEVIAAVDFILSGI